MPVRVLWVIKGLGPGGAEHLLVAAARRHRLDQFAIDCAYVLPWKDHMASALEQAGVHTHCVSSRRRDQRWVRRLWKLVRSGEYQVVHVHSPLPGSIARLAARSMGKGRRPLLVSTEHNRWATHRLPTRLLNRLTGRWDDEVIAVTDEVLQSMAGPIRRRARTLSHGIDLAGVDRGDRVAMRAELGVADGTVVIGTVANFRPQKDYPNLLRAVRLLVDRGVSARFVAVGQGPLVAETRALCTELGLDDTVMFTGFRADAVKVMGACDAFVLASQWEGLPVAVMEALALGLPIVATAVGGMAEELHDGVDALLVPPRDPDALALALERVITDADLRLRLAGASAGRAGEFDVGRAVADLEAVYTRRTITPAAVATVVAAPTKPARPASDVEVRPATISDRSAVLELLQASLGADADDRYRALFAWKHDENPFGPSPMWVAVDHGRVVSFRAFMRWEFERGGRVLRAVRAVDTATHPDYQGRGLFTLLTRHGLDEMQAEGVDFVFNTPNDQSRPGYLKMGWQVVGSVPAAVRFIGPTGAVAAIRSKVAADRWSQPLTIGRPVADWLADGGTSAIEVAASDVRSLSTRADHPYLVWRFATTLLGYRIVAADDAAVIVRARRRGSATELAVVAQYGTRHAADRLAARAAKDAGADYAIRIGAPAIRSRWLPLPGGGPVLTWRNVNEAGMPPLSNWNLQLGDVELF